MTVATAQDYMSVSICIQSVFQQDKHNFGVVLQMKLVEVSM